MISEKLNELKRKKQEYEERLNFTKDLKVNYEIKKLNYTVAFVGSMNLQYAFEAKKIDQQLNVLRKQEDELEKEIITLINEISNFVQENDIHGCELSFFYGINDIDILEKIYKDGHLNGTKI